MLFKGLVSIACVAVIAAAGIFVWDRLYAPPATAADKRAEDCAFDRERIGTITPETDYMDRALIEICEKEGY